MHRNCFHFMFHCTVSAEMMESRPTSPKFLISPCINRDLRILSLLPVDCEEQSPEGDVRS